MGSWHSTAVVGVRGVHAIGLFESMGVMNEWNGGHGGWEFCALLMDG
jgi:hypothetical protein